ncbi:A-kinase anchor protein 17A-like isoform X2 [Vanessa cardui]|nr:A-kinase anchor protein 17A-like isoform X2 [Vanessa cardui]
MEKLRKMIQPDNFSILKVSKHSSEVIRFDAELENRQKLDRVLARLEDRIIQLTDYPEPLKVKVAEVKSDFPSRHAWDSFFRDATDMDEMKPGERPDTIHIKNLPIRWFVHDRDVDDDAPPSESIFKKVFERYGIVRQVDIPAADPFRMQMKAPMRGITIPAQDASLYFEGYVQFSEYAGFVRCMDSLRGCKLLRKNKDIAEWCSIQVDFDKTKHMTDAAVKRRSIVRERLSARQRAKEEEEKREKEKIAKREAKERQKIDHHEKEKLEKMREREERRKKKQLAKLMAKDNVDLNKKVAEEQKKLLKTQKRLQAIRLIDELFKRIELRPELHQSSKRTARYYNASDCFARQRIVDNYKQQQEKALEEQRERLRHALDGRIIIRSALETKKPKRESSISSISEDERDRKRVKTEKLTTPEREVIYNKTAGMYGYPGPYGFGYPFAAVPPQYAYPQTYFPRGAYFPAEGRRPRGRGRGRGRGRLPYFDGPDATHQYYQYFKKLTEAGHRNEHDNRSRSRSRSRSHSRRRSYSRSRSRSRRRSYSRSRSRSRRSRSRRSRSRTRRSRSRSRRSRSHSRSNSRSRRRSKSRSRRSKTKSRSKSRARTPSANPPPGAPARRSRSWSLPRPAGASKSWSKSPKK